MVTVRPTRFRAALAGLVVAVALAGCAGTDPSSADSPTPGSSAADGGGAPATTGADPSPSAAAEGQRIDVQVSGGRVTGDTGRVPVGVGTAVTLVVTSDVADQAHLHGYDLAADLAPDEPTELAFDATIPGVFELELHDAGTVLLSLQVS